MPTSKALMCAALAACVLLSPSSSEARFGKSSSSSSSNSEGRNGGSRGSSERPRPQQDRPREQRERVHRASPIGQERPSRPEPSSGDGDAPRRRARLIARHRLIDFIVAGAIVTPVPVVRFTSPRARGVREAYEPVPLLVRVGVQGGPMGEGGSLGLFMAMEGRRLGLDTRITGLALPADDGTRDTDRITLLGAHMTASLWSGPRGRMRLEAGVSSAHAPDVIFVGPSLGASLEACIGRSPVDLEARVHGVPFPHQQVDAQAGLAVHLGAFHMRGGWRALYLNDAGHVDGVEHKEHLSGPYFGLGLVF